MNISEDKNYSTIFIKQKQYSLFVEYYTDCSLKSDYYKPIYEGNIIFFFFLKL